MKGYKAFNEDMTCRGFQYEIGKTYHTDEDIELCRAGFHFCGSPRRCFDYYEADSILCEVEASGHIIGSAEDKLVTDTIRVIREFAEVEKWRVYYGYGNGIGYGIGNGDGDAVGYGYGVGYGYSDGCGNGYGDGDGDYGNGSGDGYGYGSGINKILIYKED